MVRARKNPSVLRTGRYEAPVAAPRTLPENASYRMPFTSIVCFVSIVSFFYTYLFFIIVLLVLCKTQAVYEVNYAGIARL